MFEKYRNKKYIWPIKDNPGKYTYVSGWELFDLFELKFGLTRLRKIKMWFLYRFTRRHEYHIVRPRFLKPGYYDPTHMYLHSSFEVLCRYVETEMYQTSWDHDESIKAMGWEIINLYKWWIYYNSPAFEKWVESLPGKWTEMHETMYDENGNRLSLNWRDWVEQRNLERLTKLRNWLWS